MEFVVAKPIVGEPLEIRGLDRPAKSAGRREAHARQDQQNIGRPGRRLDALRKVGN